MASDAAYMREYRARNPHLKERQKKVKRARERALIELSRRHEIEYLTLLEAYRQQEGL